MAKQYIMSTEKGTAQEVFRRTEVKYVLSRQEYHDLMQKLSPYLNEDRYFKAANCSVYFDTPDNYLAIHSLEKPLYKEKVRVRSYNVPKNLDDVVFVEIKKKFNGIGSKRRIAVTLKDFYNYLATGDLETSNAQIKAELDYVFNFYQLAPALYIAYDRLSYCGKDNPAFRVTFDHNIRYRTKDLSLESGDHGIKYFQNDEVVMEVKALDSFPLWFVRATSFLKIYPASFSKYGRISQKLSMSTNN